jgi:DNA-binding CsgD family transcriptional regulator
VALAVGIGIADHRGIMQWPGERTAVASVATGVVIRIVSDEQPRRLRYGLPILLVTATTGLTLTLPAFVGRGVFDLMLLPVLAVALGLGLGPALGTVVLAGAMVTLALPPVGLPWLNDPVHLGALGLHVAEGATLAFIGAVVRATLRRALGSEPAEQAPLAWAADQTQPVGRFLAEHLTHREVEILRLAASGRSIDGLADELYVSPNTVKTHLAHCYDKLGAHSRTEAIALAVRAGVLRAADLDTAAEISRTGQESPAQVRTARGAAY